MYAEALNTYQVIVKNKMFSNAGKPNFVLFCNILEQSVALCVAYFGMPG